MKAGKNRNRETGRATNFVAPSGVRVASAKDQAIRTAWECDMSFSAICRNYGIRPEVLARTLELSPDQIDRGEWAAAQAAYDASKDVVRNELRPERDRGSCRNPLRK